MRNIKITIQYDGRKFCGWQAQNIKDRKYSVQESIEQAAKKVLKHKVSIIGSGRTDGGVHALAQVANFRTSSGIDPSKLRLALNSNLPIDIRILKAEYVQKDFHSRFSSKSKVYKYLIQNGNYRSPFVDKYSYWYKFPLNMQLMKSATRCLVGRHDFKAFCATGTDVKDTVRTIKYIKIYKTNILSNELICIEIESDGFLYNMVRNIVGTLLEVGRNRFKPAYIKEIIIGKDRSKAGFCVPAKGLFLLEAKY